MSTEAFDSRLLDYSKRAPRLPNPVDSGNDRLPIAMTTRLAMYEIQQVLRQFEKRVFALFTENLIKGATHLSIGMEAIAAGFGKALRADDYTFATYRGHAHVLARGAPLGPVMAEMLGRENGTLGGKGGSMHLTSVAHHMMGSYATVGAHLCVANGTAWSARLRGSGQVTVCFFGDGATNTGAFHEALNLATVWSLPVVFVCENNLYMEYTPIDAASAVHRPAADRASAYGLPSLVIDGNDADAVYWTATDLIARARRGEGPSLVEAVTYRQGGHNPADLGQYRPPQEVQAWLTRDPIPVYHQRLLRLGVSEERLATIVQEVSNRVEDATEFAKDGRPPDDEHLSADLFADGGSAWRN